MINWIFFALNAKPTSMRRALAERIAISDHVVIVEQPVSILRDRRIPPLKERCALLEEGKAAYLYRPLHYPEGLPVTKKIFRGLNYLLMKRELVRRTANLV